MHNIKAYKTRGLDSAKISKLPVKRDWMDQTANAHAYKCFPVTLTNSLGWSLSFPEDISFVWDGVSDSSPHHVRILSGEKYIHTNRANGTVSFNTGVVFRTDPNVTMLAMPAPNVFYDGAQSFTTLISTSFFSGEFPVVWRITRPMSVITIKANQPIASIFPISLGDLDNSIIEVDDIANMPKTDIERRSNLADHIKAVDEATILGKWTNFYRDAVDYMGNKLGSHEVKSLHFNVKDLNEKN